MVDSPPLGAVTDSLLIAESTDEVVYVCRFNRALRKHIRLYIKALRQGKNEILGVVLNMVAPTRQRAFDYYRRRTTAARNWLSLPGWGRQPLSSGRRGSSS